MPDLRLEPSYDDLLFVMGIVRRNAELLAERLTALGWRPLTGIMVGCPHSRPFPDEAAAESLGAGPLPAALVAFWQTVGSLDFVWDSQCATAAPDLFGNLPLLALDPLYVDGPDSLFYAVEMWRGMVEQGDLNESGTYRLDLAPDRFHKANISGGSPYGIALPTDDTDPWFGGEGYSARFTDYLRAAFNWGGFPGLATAEVSDRLSSRIFELTKDFEKF